MPIYTYFCHACDSYFEKNSCISDYQDKEACPICHTIRDVTRALGYDIETQYRTVVANDNDITLKQLAERNTKKMSRDEKIDRYYEQNKYKWEGQDPKLPDGMTRINKKDKDSAMKKIEKKITS